MTPDETVWEDLQRRSSREATVLKYSELQAKARQAASFTPAQPNPIEYVHPRIDMTARKEEPRPWWRFWR